MNYMMIFTLCPHEQEKVICCAMWRRSQSTYPGDSVITSCFVAHALVGDVYNIVTL